MEWKRELEKLEGLLREEGVHERIRKVLRFALSKYGILDFEISERELRECFDTLPMYDVFASLHFEAMTEIYLSQCYLILNLISEYYLLGVNFSTGRLFLMRLTPIPLPDDFMTYFKWNLILWDRNYERYLKVIFLRDEGVRKCFLVFDEDRELFDGEFKRGFNYRVQGDVVMSVYGTIDDYLFVLKSEILRRLMEVVHEVIADRIADILESFHINCDIRRIDSLSTSMVIFQFWVPKGFDLDGYLSKFMEFMKRVIKERLYVEDIVQFLTGKCESLECVELKEDSPYLETLEFLCEGFSLRIDIGCDVMGYPDINAFAEVRITPAIDVDSFALKVKEVVDFLRESGFLEFEEFKFNVGRHVVKCSALPTSLTFTFRVLDRETVFGIFDLPLCITGKFVLEHPEHGVREFELDGPLCVRFFTIEPMDDFYAQINTSVVRRIVEGFPL